LSVIESRGAYDVHLFTNDREKLGSALGHDVSHQSAHAPEQKQEQAIAPQREIGPRQEQGQARVWNWYVTVSGRVSYSIRTCGRGRLRPENAVE
jgi:hypothetical protein